MLISVIVLGVLALVDPLRPVVFVFVLRTQVLNAIALLIGWTVALSVLFVAVFVAFGGNLSSAPSRGLRTAASVAEIGVGVALVVVAARRWRRRGEEASSPGYQQALLDRLDRLDVRRSAGVGVLIQPRALTVAAALVIARDRTSRLGSLIGFGTFAVVSTATLLAILAYAVWRPELAEPRLTDTVAALERRGPVIVTGLCAVGGAYLVLDGLRALFL